MVLGLDIFEEFGLNFLCRWAHVLVGITWIGLLYYFNFVQVPAFAELEPGARNQAIDKLASRALWWFRWAAAATLAFGILLIGLIPTTDGGDGAFLTDDYLKSRAGHQHLHRHAARHHDVPERVAGDLAATRRRSSPTPATCSPAARPTPTRGRRGPARRCSRRVRTPSSRSRCCSSWSGPRTSSARASTPPAATAASTGRSPLVHLARVRAELPRRHRRHRAQNARTGSTRTTSARSATGLVLMVVWYLLWEIFFG